mmetsp:Transcript_13470/g.13034  ORF Transcript_13470/g.13034 Transcript_13470/m.13034 type:complete len:353 (-) Transcript_13470:742-1800(-)
MLQDHYAKMKGQPYSVSYPPSSGNQGPPFESEVSIVPKDDVENVKVYTGLSFRTKKESEQNAAEKAFKDRNINSNTSNNGFFPSINDPTFLNQITSTLQNPIDRPSDSPSSVTEEPTNQKNISKDVPSNPSINDTRIDIDDLTVSSMSNLNLDGNDNDKEDTEACLGNNSLAGTLSSDSTCEGEDKGSEAKNGNHIPVFIIEKLQEFLDLSNTDPSFKNLQSEESLANFLKNRMSSTGAVLKAEEWDVVEGESHQGRGDLVFRLLFDIDLRLPFGIDLVVEVKKIDPISTGGSNKTHSTTRNKQRSKVEEQAIKYAKIWQCSKSDVEIVVATIFTEEDGLKCIHGFTNRSYS